jgi:hypothetical protein
MSPLLTREEKFGIVMILSNIQDDLEEHGLLEIKDRI